ncbi:uncharacterized protein LOC134542863 [Bacillus rossius redtenbacheri]|uniref:uncharacterized protein LOC134529013 n=1 Tax=Bacillus rossius redtenbacheri TaxID=93214 RepID=UPI002FDD712F
MTSSQKSERFSSIERSILLGLVRSWAHVIECKKTDFSNLAAKKDAWARIECEFNSQPDVIKRSSAQLKKCWENVKTKQKKALALATRQRMATGGGPFVKDPPTDPELEIALGGVLHCVDDAVDCDMTFPSEASASVEIVMPQSNNTGSGALSTGSLLVNASQEEPHSIVLPTPVSGFRARNKPAIDVEVERRFLNLERADKRARRVLAMQQAEHRLKLRASKAMAEAEEQRLANEQAEAARAVEAEKRAIKFELMAEQRRAELHAQQMRHADELHKLRIKILTEANDVVF